MKPSKAFDKLVEKYYLIYGANPEYNYFLEQFIDEIRKGRILDLGCGAGIPVAKKLVNHGYDVVGVDVSKKMVESARKNVPAATFINEDMVKFKITPESYDGVVAFFSLNHVRKKDAQGVVDKIYAGLRDGGVLLIGLLQGAYEGKGMVLGEQVDMTLYSEDELRILLKEFYLELFEAREFSIQGEPIQQQMFAIAKKDSSEHGFAEKLVDEIAKEVDEKKEKKEKPDKEKKKHEQSEEDEEPLIRISLGLGKKAKSEDSDAN